MREWLTEEWKNGLKYDLRNGKGGRNRIGVEIDMIGVGIDGAITGREKRLFVEVVGDDREDDSGNASGQHPSFY